MLKKLLAFTVIVEIATALAVMAVPRLVVALLLGGDIAGVGIAVARCFGIALLALGLACWPAQSNLPAFRGMLVYNTLIALIFVYVFAAEHMGGVLLWPAAVLHAIVAVLLVVAWRAERRQAAAAGGGTLTSS